MNKDNEKRQSGINLTEYLPPETGKYYKMKKLTETESEELNLLWAEQARTLNNSFVLSADEDGLKRFERIFGLYPKAETPLEDRRNAVLHYISENPPYTPKRLNELIGAIVGAGNFAVDINHGAYTLEVLLNAVARVYKNEVDALLKRVCPANLLLAVSDIYLSHKLIEETCHKDVAKYTHEKLRVAKSIPPTVAPKWNWYPFKEKAAAQFVSNATVLYIPEAERFFIYAISSDNMLKAYSFSTPYDFIDESHRNMMGDSSRYGMQIFNNKAVSVSGRLMFISRDGLTYDRRRTVSPYMHTMERFTYGNGRYVASFRTMFDVTGRGAFMFPEEDEDGEGIMSLFPGRTADRYYAPNILALTFLNGRFFGYGSESYQEGDTTPVLQTSIYVTSTDGINWERGNTNLVADFGYKPESCAASGKGVIVVCRTDGLFISRDGINFERAYSAAMIGSNMDNIKFTGDYFFAKAVGGVLISDDGINWDFLDTKGTLSVPTQAYSRDKNTIVAVDVSSFVTFGIFK